MADKIKREDLFDVNGILQAIDQIAQQMGILSSKIKSLANESKNLNSAISSSKGMKDYSTNTKKAATNLNELDTETKEYNKLVKRLETEQAKLNNMFTKEYEQLRKVKEEQRKRNAQIKEATANTNTWRTALGSFAAKFNTIGNVASNVISAISRGIKNLITDSIRLAAVSEGITNAFNKLDSPGLLKELKTATRGAVSDMELMKAAVQANNFKIPLDQLAVFLQFAGNRALETGEDFNYLVESIVKGLGRKSVLILDNLGLSVSEINKEVAKTGDFMTGAANVIAREMGASGAVVNTAATQMARVRAQAENAKTAFGNLILSNSNLIKGFSNFYDISEAQLSTWKKLNIAFDDTPERIEAVKKAMADEEIESAALIEQIREFKKQYQDTGVEQKKQIKTIADLATEIENLTAEKQTLSIEDEAEFIRINKLIKAKKEQIQRLDELGTSYKKLTEIRRQYGKEDIDLSELEAEIDEALSFKKEEVAQNDEDIESARLNRRRMNLEKYYADNIKMLEDFSEQSIDINEVLFSTIDEFVKNRYDNESERMSDNYSAKLEQAQAEYNLAIQNGANEIQAQAALDEKKNAIEEKYKQDQKNMTKKYAIIEASIDIAKVIASGAAAKALATATAAPLLANPLTAALGATLLATAKATINRSTITSIAAIAGQTAILSAFAKGTDNSPEGLALVGEKGSELMIDKKGNVGLTPDKASLAYLQQGTKIIPADVTKELIKNTMLSNVIAGKEKKDGTKELVKELKESNAKLRRDIRNKKEVYVSINEAGFQVKEQRGRTLTNRLDKYFRN